MKVTCSQEIDLSSFQTALGLALFDPLRPRLEYRVLAVKHDDQQLQSTAPFKWVQAGGEILVWGLGFRVQAGGEILVWGLGFRVQAGGEILVWGLGFKV
jgi:hypothetical protein